MNLYKKHDDNCTVNVVLVLLVLYGISLFSCHPPSFQMRNVQEQDIIQQCNVRQSKISDAASVANKPLLKMLPKDACMHGNKRVSCAICKKQFIRQSNLKKQKRTHTDVLFSCNKCRQQFSGQSRLKDRILHVHDKKLFSCVICKKQFIRQSNLKKHERTHILCAKCTQQFSKKINLAVSACINSTDSALSADFLIDSKDELNSELNGVPGTLGRDNNGFFSSNLQLCDSICTDENPFLCAICKKQFSSQNNLDAHACIQSTNRQFPDDFFNVPYNINAEKVIKSLWKNIPPDSRISEEDPLTNALFNELDPDERDLLDSVEQ